MVISYKAPVEGDGNSPSDTNGTGDSDGNGGAEAGSHPPCGRDTAATIPSDIALYTTNAINAQQFHEQSDNFVASFDTNAKSKRTTGMNPTQCPPYSSIGVYLYVLNDCPSRRCG